MKMKKITIALLAIAMLFAFVACEDDSTPAPKNAINLKDIVLAGEMFQNSDTVELKTEDGKNYVVTGKLAPMKAEQAAAFGGMSEGATYVSLEIETKGTEETRRGWVTAENAFKDPSDLNFENDFKIGVKKTLTEDDSPWGMVLAVTSDGTTVRPEVATNPVWRVELTDGESTTVYTVDFSAYLPAQDE